MLNRAPIFVIGFQRGGTALLTNLLVSHPDVRHLGRETHQVFYGKDSEPIARWGRRLLYLPILLAAREHLFRPKCAGTRHGDARATRRLGRYTDLLLYWNARREGYVSEASAHLRPAEAPRRLLCKNVGGSAFATALLAAMYPDATFIALVRNGFAICEGYTRRGWSTREVARTYEQVCQRMIRDAAAMPNYHVIRFEDMIADPVAAIERVYAYAGLDPAMVTRFRLQAQPFTDPNGERRFAFAAQRDRETHWFSWAEIPQCFRKDVNENQLKRLGETDRTVFLEHARPSMEHFGYL